MWQCQAGFQSQISLKGQDADNLRGWRRAGWLPGTPVPGVAEAPPTMCGLVVKRSVVADRGCGSPVRRRDRLQGRSGRRTDDTTRLEPVPPVDFEMKREKKEEFSMPGPPKMGLASTFGILQHARNEPNIASSGRRCPQLTAQSSEWSPAVALAGCGPRHWVVPCSHHPLGPPSYDATLHRTTA
jgi:hypothetical protein